MVKKLKLPTPNPYSAKSDTEVNLEWAMNQKGRANRTAAFAMVTKRRGQTREITPEGPRRINIPVDSSAGARALYYDEAAKANAWSDYRSPIFPGKAMPLRGSGSARGKVRG